MLTVLKQTVFLCLLAILIGSTQCLAKNKHTYFKVLGTNKLHASTLKMVVDEHVGDCKPIVQQSRADSTITHIVKQGETLYSISNEYGVSVNDIKRWNGLSGNSINVGEKLKIYPQKVNPEPPQTGQKSTSGKGRYTVKSGDTLFRIAQMYQMSVKKLKSLNNLTSNTIRVGQELIVESSGSTERASNTAVYGKFTHYTVSNTVTRDSLLAKFGMGKEEFLALNPAFSDTTMSAGDQVKLLIPPTKSRKNPYRITKDVKGLGMMAASEYPPNMFGTTTNGELYNPKALTAGSPNLEIGTVIFVKNKQNGRGVFVRINDRTTGSGLTLSEAAWDALQLTGSGNKVMVFLAHE